ncbi:uncharacterized protein J4E92_010117 [Alternaria infectoria]|uniref:uncharacterized protein n=1 Tax=Alternaria infectoria TaxID=45303 RepID=UPI00221ED07C|nr:uncharacterized protein J4E92_010117 [Alternaria infectoria]KAI4912266.1 hypothetical protein J4E92_010117 [Alternaria infectoria]
MSSNQPSQASTAPASLPSGTSLEAVIGGIGYSLPSSDEDSIEVMLLDGSVAQLFAGKIIIGDQTVTLPSDLSSETTLPGGISAKPAEATTPDDDDNNDGGGGGVGGLFGALGGIARGATSALGGAIGGVDAVTSGALAFAGGTAGAISGPLTGAIGDTGKFVSSLNGIQKSFPGNELTKGAFDTFTSAHQLARQSLNWMKSTQNLAQNFDDLSSDVQSKVMSGAGEFVKAGGTLARCKTAMEAFQDFPWEDAEVPSQTAQPSATDKHTETASTQSTKGTSTTQITSLQSTTDMASTTQSTSSTVTSSQTSSSSSETPTPTADLKREYMISSKHGTPWTSFKTLIDNLDGGEGFLARFDSIESYMYVTMLNSTQAAEIADTNDWIEWIGLNTGGVPEEELEDFAEERRDSSVEPVQWYHIASKHDTPWEKFKALIDTIDGVENSLVRWDYIGSYMYVAKMTATRAKEISESHDFIKWIGINDGGVPEEELENLAKERRAVGVAQTGQRSLSDTPKPLRIPASTILHPETTSGDDHHIPPNDVVSSKITEHCGNELPASIELSESSTATFNRTLSSSSETPIATATTEQEYAIHSKDDTPPDVFKSFIDELDGGKGHLYIWEALGGQLYITLLNAAQAKELPENHDFIEHVFRNTIAEAFEGDEASQVAQSVQAGNNADSDERTVARTVVTVATPNLLTLGDFDFERHRDENFWIGEHGTM